MSFEIFVAAFEGGEPRAFPTAILEETFRPYVQTKSDGCWVLQFADGGAPEVFVATAGNVDNFMVSRPPRSLEFWSALLEVMRRTRAICFWPGGDRPVVAIDGVEADLPMDMLEALGRPIKLEDAAAFRAEIER